MLLNFIHLNKALIALSCALALPYVGLDAYATQDSKLIDKSDKVLVRVRGERGHRGDKGHRGKRGHVGSQGTTGPRGATGATGAAGAAGAIGATGATGPANGLNAYAGAVLIEPALNPLLTVLSGEDISFPVTTVTPVGINLIGTSGFQASTAGNYEITYGVESAAAVLFEVGIAVNGAVNTDTVLAPLVAVTAVNGSFILPLAAGDTVTIHNSSLLTLTLNASPSVGAFITIKKLN